MGFPSGVFSDTYSGRLQIVYGGRWLVNLADYGGTGGWELLIRGVAQQGSDIYKVTLGMNNNSGVIELDYVANTTVSVWMEYVTHTLGGAGSVQAKKLRIRCRLGKR